MHATRGFGVIAGRPVSRVYLTDNDEALKRFSTTVDRWFWVGLVLLIGSIAAVLL